MMSKSYANLLDLSGESPMFTQTPRRSLLPRSHTVAAIATELREEETTNSVTSEAPSSICSERLILVSNMLPLTAEKPDGRWKFEWDTSALQFQLKDGLGKEREVLHVGCLSVEVEHYEQEDVRSMLLDRFNCLPVFLDQRTRSDFYHGFCKQYLWPLFHYNLPLSADQRGHFDPNLWTAYVSANTTFAHRLREVIDPESCYVWIHDYHLMALPTILRRHGYKLRMGFFLHSPFPSSEIYRTCPKREELLRGLLNADLIGFHTFDYARHFLSCCSRMLGLGFESKRGYIGVEYYGRTVGIKISPVGVHLPQLSEHLRSPVTEWRMGELREQFKDRVVMLGVDDVDAFKGLGFKLAAFEKLLETHPDWRGKAVLVQIMNSARGRGRDVDEVREEVHEISRRIRRLYGAAGGYNPVEILDRHVPLYERIAFYSIAQCCVVTAVRDGMNLIPYEYTVCRQGLEPPTPDPSMRGGVVGGGRTPTSALSSPGSLGAMGGGGGGADGAVPSSSSSYRRKSMIIVSEFIGCSPSLSGALRVNPWNIEAVSEAMNTALLMPEVEQCMRHDRHFRYVSTHSVSHWAESFMADLERACREHPRLQCYGVGFGHGFRVIALDPNFRKLGIPQIARAYKQANKSRAILLDYDGTMTTAQGGSLNRAPSAEVLSMLESLCADKRNVVFIVSGRTKQVLAEWFAPVRNLGLAAEHGYYFRWHRDEEWQTLVPPPVDLSWQEVALPVMEAYMESTDGSSIERKESALVWHHHDADPEFGSWQAKELLDHLDSVLAGGRGGGAGVGLISPGTGGIGGAQAMVAVKSGNHIVEAKPQGVSKGEMVKRILKTMVAEDRAPDFVLCVGDDRSDEDMFESIKNFIAFAFGPPAPLSHPHPHLGTAAATTTTSSASGGGTGGDHSHPPPPLLPPLAQAPQQQQQQQQTRAPCPPPSSQIEVFPCTVGQKPSRAKYYLDDSAEVLAMLQGLASVSLGSPDSSSESQLQSLSLNVEPAEDGLATAIT